MTIAIEFRHVKKEYQAQNVIQDLNLAINKGELFVLVGESGSGKTTTLKMINRLEKLNAGEIIINGNDIANLSNRELRQDIGYVLQQIALFPTMTVAQNIAVIPEMKGMNKSKINEITHELLMDVGLDPKSYWNRKPNELSGGEQQRIGILRAIAAQPDIVLMDEPFSALDPLSRQQLQNLVIRMHDKYHSTIVFVTHDMNEALKLGDRVGIMSKGEIVQVDTPTQIAQNPTNDFVRNFFSASRAKNIYDIYLGRVGIVQGYLTEKPIGEIKTLDEQATLRDTFAVLAEYEYVAVTDKTQILGYLNRKQIIAYLTQHEKD
ncbi:ABC transporter ATP-binding protein [Weissella koreensis]|uniref:ABC-type quaternary amine transporter n=1 Tax=Weissella koreensis TaxID=165096 RepID=A0A7H1MLK1_9LACO|nr:ABC transporter ATP-binding protein [Weissella koreensis]AEJ23500.1 glycine betaine/carnitine/choline ABC transporter, ATP-binding protein [Weissella koreensis KACC 15510]AVH75134.1 ABC transporter ATP-binding protein [Weissella koreensis]QGN20358.1 ATP-binding cassette domain-containing protein [Weissella koreensis]QNT64337.1 ABC transporter ATP-binding protein [Weissella koreensis]